MKLKTFRDFGGDSISKAELKQALDDYMDGLHQWSQEVVKSDKPWEAKANAMAINNQFREWMLHFTDTPDPLLKGLKCHGGSISLFDLPCCECKAKKSEG